MDKLNFKFADTNNLWRIYGIREKALMYFSKRVDGCGKNYCLSDLSYASYGGIGDEVDIETITVKVDCDTVGLAVVARGILGEYKFRSYYCAVLLNNNTCFESIPINSETETGYILYKNAERFATLQGLKKGKYSFTKNWLICKPDGATIPLDFPNTISSSKLYQIEYQGSKYPLRLGTCYGFLCQSFYALRGMMLLLLIWTCWPKWFDPSKYDKKKDYVLPLGGIYRNEGEMELWFMLNVTFRNIFSSFETA